MPGTMISLSGDKLTIAKLVRIARSPDVRVSCTRQAMDRVRESRGQIETIIDRYQNAWKQYEARWEDYEAKLRPEPPAWVEPLEYGVTTGFGEFKDIGIAPDDLRKVSPNILLSHAVGIGDSSTISDWHNYYSPEVVRAVLTLRINAFLKGHSGVSVDLIETLVAMVNSLVIPLVPLHGSVGASGDLAPLAHLFCPLVGEGSFVVVDSLVSGYKNDDQPISGDELESAIGRAIPELRFKEGLALTNGASFSAAILALAVHDGEVAAAAADVALALSVEAIMGCARAFDRQVHMSRGQTGQIDSAGVVRRLLADSAMVEGGGRVQDPYSIRCGPQVHGAARDALAYARMVVTAELNAATDNPLFFPGSEPWDWEFRKNWPGDYSGLGRVSYSAGNFHGEPVAIACDLLSIALAELASISERRIQMLLDKNHNCGLPAALVAVPAVNSGYMIAQYCAASLVSENKVLAHPASVDSIPTSANSEDHVSMSAAAARKVKRILGNTQSVLGIEMVIATQAVEWRAIRTFGRTLAPEDLLTTDVDELAPGGLSTTAPPGLNQKWEKAQEEEATFGSITGTFAGRSAIADKLGQGTKAAYLSVRRSVDPLIGDRFLSSELWRARQIVESGSLIADVEVALGRIIGTRTARIE